jgi:hypothetical protein
MKLFGVLLTVLVLLGAVVGGVVGVLLPKISSGLALGFLCSLYLGVVSRSRTVVVWLCVGHVSKTVDRYLCNFIAWDGMI